MADASCCCAAASSCSAARSLALALASCGLQAYKFSPASVIGFRIAIFTRVRAARRRSGSSGRCGRRVTDLQVALYVEEHEPSLQAAILSAVDIGATSRRRRRPTCPPVISTRWSSRPSRRPDDSRAAGASAARPSGAAAIALGTLAAVGRAAARRRSGVPPSGRVGAARAVTQRGSRQPVRHQGHARRRRGAEGLGPDGRREARRIPIERRRADGEGRGRGEVRAHAARRHRRRRRRSKACCSTCKKPIDVLRRGRRREVADLLDDGRRAAGRRRRSRSSTSIPAYTGLPPQKVEVGGDVAALRGHRSARPRDVHDGDARRARCSSIPAQPPALAVAAGRHAHRQLQDRRRRLLPRRARRPARREGDRVAEVHDRRDRRSAADGVVREAEARHDGESGRGSVRCRRAPRTTSACRQLDLVYSVNGGAEKTVTLYGKGAKALDEVSAGHTIYLEELGVKPGDFVSYYAKAHRHRHREGTEERRRATSTSSKIRPFSQNFRAGAVAGRRRRWRRRWRRPAERGRRAVRAAAADHLGDVQRRSRPARRRPPTSSRKTPCSSACAVASCARRSRSSSQQMQQRLGGGGGENIRKIAERCRRPPQEMQRGRGAAEGAEDEGSARRPSSAR